MVINKFGRGDHLWFPNAISSSYGVGVRKGICKGWRSFVRHISFEIRDDSTVRFWSDRWCDDITLGRSFPNLFNIASEKECLVSSLCMLIEEDRVSWNPIFRRNLHDWEIESFLQFFSKLYSHRAVSRADQVTWNGLKNKKFSVKYFYLDWCIEKRWSFHGRWCGDP